MTVGEKIQAYRKKLGLSQEELGEKLLVSRQTISLWEKGQTLPTIDNLIKLKDIFNVSVDEILDTEDKRKFNCFDEQNYSKGKYLPLEKYRFGFAKEEVDEVNKEIKKEFIKNVRKFLVFLLLTVMLFITSQGADIFKGIWLGFILIGGLVLFHAYKIQKINIKKNEEQLSLKMYDCEVYSNYFFIKIYKAQELIKELKIYFDAIEKTKDFGNYIIVLSGNDNIIFKKADLINDSVFFRKFQNKVNLKVKKPLPTVLKTLSIILFVASILSIYIALPLTCITLGEKDILLENMWKMFLFTPIPISSIVLGFVLKAKGYKYLKNVIVGFIMTGLLCVFGSFTFIFDDVYSYDDTRIIEVEQITKIDIPEYIKVRTEDYVGSEQSDSEEKTEYITDVFFEQEDVQNFEEMIAENPKWLTNIPSELEGAFSFFSKIYGNDYVLLYNVDTDEYNKLPSETGKYKFINIFYNAEENIMKIVEYNKNIK